MPDPLSEKEEKLARILRGMQRVVVSFSGGVDSTLLLAAAIRTLGLEAVHAVNICSPLSSKRDKEDVLTYGLERGVPLISLDVNELLDESVVRNDKRRCYHCKKLRIERLLYYAEKHSIEWILDGSNQDDLGEYRPGMEALRETEKAQSPLLEAGFTKTDVRDLAERWKLSCWNKPSAACLASRIPYGQELSFANLNQVDAAEQFLRLFLPQDVVMRVRHHGNLARVEVGKDGIPSVINHADEIVMKLKSIGFYHVTLDLNLYQTGCFDYN